MIFADDGAGGYAPVLMEHKLAGHQAIGGGLGTVRQSVRAPLVQNQLTPSNLQPASVPVTQQSGAVTTTSLIDSSPLRPTNTYQPYQPTKSEPMPAPPPLPQPQPAPPGTRFPTPTPPTAPGYPVNPPAAPGVYPTGSATSPSPVPGATYDPNTYPGSMGPVAPTSSILDVNVGGKPDSNLKWILIGGAALLGVVGLFAIFR